MQCLQRGLARAGLLARKGVRWVRPAGMVMHDAAILYHVRRRGCSETKQGGEPGLKIKDRYPRPVSRVVGMEPRLLRRFITSCARRCSPARCGHA